MFNLMMGNIEWRFLFLAAAKGALSLLLCGTTEVMPFRQAVRLLALALSEPMGERQRALC